MTYTIFRPENVLADAPGERAVAVVLKTTNKHTLPESFEDFDYFLYESGHITAPNGKILEITRIFASCEEMHRHELVYRAPREISVWEAMFAIGEIPEDGIDPEELFANSK